MWSNFYETGGFGMYPTTLFGFLLVAASVLLVLRPQRRLMPLVGTLSALTFVSGFLGCSIGFINTFLYIQKVPFEKQFQIACIGAAESLNNIVLAQLILIIAGLLIVAAVLREMRRPNERQTPSAF